MSSTNCGPLAVELPDAQWRRQFRRTLLAWYRRRARDLPWRRTRDPYCVWISEVMLQQTQVATVIPYYTRFLNAFSTIAALAAAPEDAVLRQWEGLGYYRRARQLHRAAGILVDQHGGNFPKDPAVVRTLPGIGRYTAGAICSIAFDLPEPILEANTIRLHSRLLAYSGPPQQAQGQRLLWAAAAAVLPRSGAGEVNQALMELGALVCLPQAPRCEECPAAAICPTHRLGLQQSIPPPALRPAMLELHEAAVVVRRDGAVLLRRCGPEERWAGLWDFPRFPLTARRGAKLRRELAAGVSRLTGLVVAPGSKLATLKHGVTRFRITLDCYQADCLDPACDLPSPDIRWVPIAAIDSYPLSTTGRQLTGLLAAR